MPICLIAGEDSVQIDQLCNGLEIEGRETIWNREQWDNFCMDMKEKGQSVIFCAIPDTASELIYDALLQKEIYPDVIVSSMEFNVLYGRKVNDDSCINMTFEAVVYEKRITFDKVYLLSGVERILPDAMLNYMIRDCGKVVLIGKKSICDAFKKHCIGLGEIEVSYVENREQIIDNANKKMDALWFYLDFPAEGVLDQFNEVFLECMKEGIYLSRYFLDHYLIYGEEYDKCCFTHEEIEKMKCLKQMQVWEDEYTGHSIQNMGKRQILFLCPYFSFLWDGIAPLFNYYIQRDDTECTVVFPSVWDTMKEGGGIRNLKETVDNICVAKKLGGMVRFYKNWDQDKEYDVCYMCLGYASWYDYGVKNILSDIYKSSKMVISLQTIGYHTHYYIGNQKFEDMFSEHLREQTDYVVASEFMAEWVKQKDEKWASKLLPFGYPRMDRLYEDMHNCHIPYEWRQKTEGKKVIYFTAYQHDLFMHCLEYCKKNALVLIWRPHPYDFDSSRTRERIEEWRSKENVIIDTNQSYSIAFNISDALVTTFCSSVQINYLFTDKPVLILDKGYLGWGG